ncbi:MAG: hypothetical protein GY754_06725, partial [bacterium]|nr:hypothetical protein [bacterium]
WEELECTARSRLSEPHGKQLYRLITAAKHSQLQTLTPFTSVGRLCFDGSGGYPFEDLKTAFIGLARDGSYAVFACSPYDDDGLPKAEHLTTADPSKAVEATVNLLFGAWPSP